MHRESLEVMNSRERIRRRSWRSRDPGNGAVMQSRIDVTKITASSTRAMQALETYVRSSRLEPALLELVRMRAS